MVQRATQQQQSALVASLNQHNSTTEGCGGSTDRRQHNHINGDDDYDVALLKIKTLRWPGGPGGTTCTRLVSVSHVQALSTGHVSRPPLTIHIRPRQPVGPSQSRDSHVTRITRRDRCPSVKKRAPPCTTSRDDDIKYFSSIGSPASPPPCDVCTFKDVGNVDDVLTGYNGLTRRC